jgi:adenine-specific DNA-methyltransferase
MTEKANEPEKLDLRSHDIAEDKRLELLRLFPEIRTEGGQLDFDRLKLALGEAVDAGKERYGMNWPGKADCFRTIQAPSLGTLLPCTEESANFDTTENLIIEGDNLEVLKLLQKSYLGKVKMIYIDPPYNTGNDFIYPDNYTESLQTYQEYTGQIDAEGKKFGTNTDADGRFHSKWLNMMYPRLYLAKNLLREDGVIFVSIDDAELENAKRLLNELFGENSFLGQVVRATGTTTGQDAGGFGKSFDYVLCYSPDTDFSLSGIPLDESDERRFSEEDKRGKYSTLQLRKTGNADRRGDRPSMYYPVTAPNGEAVYPIGPGGYESRWRFGPETYKEYVADDLVVWKQVDRDGQLCWQPYVKYYLEGRTKRPSPLWDDIDGNKKASHEVKELLGERVFSNPKPKQLIVRLMEVAGITNTGGIILDFFAGSGTTAHAALDVNTRSIADCKFLLVQLPEPLDPSNKDQKPAADFCTSIGKPCNISEITKERVRRVIKKLNGENTGKLDLNGAKKQDRGFRVFKLAVSNFNPWNAEAPKDVGADRILTTCAD